MGFLRRLGFTSFAFWFGSIGGVALGAGAMLFLFPFLFPPPELSEEAPAEAVLAEQVKGRTRIAFEFDRNAPGRDLIHWANGTGALIRTQQGWVLRFDQEFEAGPGPNYWIYFNKRAVGDEDDFNADAARVKMSQLRSFRAARIIPSRGYRPRGLPHHHHLVRVVWRLYRQRRAAQGKLSERTRAGVLRRRHSPGAGRVARSPRIARRFRFAITHAPAAPRAPGNPGA